MTDALPGECQARGPAEPEDSDHAVPTSTVTAEPEPATVASFWGDEVAELEPTLDEEERLGRLARDSAPASIALAAGKSESGSDSEEESGPTGAVRGSGAARVSAFGDEGKEAADGDSEGSGIDEGATPAKMSVMDLRYRMEFFASIAKGHMGEVRMALKPTCKKGSVPRIPDVNCRDEVSLAWPGLPLPKSHS